MAHFAKIGNDNIVERVEVVSNNVVTDEQAGITFLQNLYNDTATWKQTSYNNNIRKNFAGIGYTYDSSKDAFISAQPYSSWTLNDDTCRWEAPVAYPDDGELYEWNEDTTSWDAV
jgi:hypothetical protein